jgi:malonate-semialdehyde dehydrogenase (acetylating)/methylmalonate-semialdehyde dehydrogenase
MSSPMDHSKTATRRLHATAQHLKPAAALAFNAENYPISHEKIQHVQDTPYFIDNKFVKSEATQFIELHDPATNNLVTRVPQSTDAELKAAVESAQKAFPAWRATSVMARQQIMFKFTQLVRDNWDRLAASITLEQGKTFAGIVIVSDTKLYSVLITPKMQREMYFVDYKLLKEHATFLSK